MARSCSNISSFSAVLGWGTIYRNKNKMMKIQGRHSNIAIPPIENTHYAPSTDRTIQTAEKRLSGLMIVR